MEAINQREKIANKITFIGMIINVLLVAIKLVSGICGKSVALISDAVNSLSDFIVDIIVIIGFRFTSKPADEKHNYGHGKIETITAVIIGIFLIIISVSLFISSGSDIYHFFHDGKKIAVPKTFVIIIIIISIIVKEILYHTTKAIGQKIKSDVLIAKAWDHRSDSISSLAALIGISLAIIFGKNFAVCDPIASLIVSFFIFRVGLNVLLANYKQLIDESLTNAEIDEIINIINSIKEIKGYHNIKTRRIGYYVSIDVHIFVDRDLNVEVAHGIASNLEAEIYKKFGKETFVSVHVEPFYPNYPDLS